MTEQQRRDNLIAGLRAMADFLETYPQVPTPRPMTANVFLDADELPLYARLTSWTKRYIATWFALSKDFGGGVTLDLNVDREQVCRKVVTGTRLVPATPALPALPEREEPIEEWVCDEPILAGGGR